MDGEIRDLTNKETDRLLGRLSRNIGRVYRMQYYRDLASCLYDDAKDSDKPHIKKFSVSLDTMIKSEKKARQGLESALKIVGFFKKEFKIDIMRFSYYLKKNGITTREYLRRWFKKNIGIDVYSSSSSSLIKRKHLIEMKELKEVLKLERLGYNEEFATAVVSEPELLIFFHLEKFRDKYGISNSLPYEYQGSVEKPEFS